MKKDLEMAILFIAKKLKNYNYAIRGTASLVLQGIDMNVDDIDILTDKETALLCNKLFKDYITHEIKYSESPKFKSYFGAFVVNNTTVEVMGEWEIKTPSGNWVKPNLMDKKEIEVDGEKVWVTTIENELTTFAAMGRWNALNKIKRQIGVQKS